MKYVNENDSIVLLSYDIEKESLCNGRSVNLDHLEIVLDHNGLTISHDLVEAVEFNYVDNNTIECCIISADESILKYIITDITCACLEYDISRSIGIITFN